MNILYAVGNIESFFRKIPSAFKNGFLIKKNHN